MPEPTPAALVACPSCDAKAGEDCLNDQGRPVPWRHVDREVRYPRCAWTLTDIYDVQWVCTLPQHDPSSLHDPIPVAKAGEQRG